MGEVFKGFALFGFANLVWQVVILLQYERMAAHLDEYEGYALEKWRSPLLPMVYEQRAKIRAMLIEQKVIVVICGVCFLVLLYVATK